jgi:hypothetical protein
MRETVSINCSDFFFDIEDSLQQAMGNVLTCWFKPENIDNREFAELVEEKSKAAGDRSDGNPMNLQY